MYNLDNYRGTIASKIIEQSVMSYIEDNGILGDVQARGLSDGTDQRRTTFLLYKGHMQLENQKE